MKLDITGVSPSALLLEWITPVIRDNKVSVIYMTVAQSNYMFGGKMIETIRGIPVKYKKKIVRKRSIYGPDNV